VALLDLIDFVVSRQDPIRDEVLKYFGDRSSIFKAPETEERIILK